jgi:predicted dithiol-disulfide oxidoreductase (DUF899 family)
VDPGLEDLHGDSVFFKDNAGQIFHTYSTFGRGGEELLGTYRYLDVMPKGRDENGPYRSLAELGSTGTCTVGAVWWKPTGATTSRAALAQ